MNHFHIVQKNDSLTKIAKQYGISVTELRKFNDLPNPNKLDIGQRIALRKEAVCGFEALFLDADRNPIKNLEYILEFCGKSIKGVTGEDGKAKKLMTDWPADQVRILVKRFDGTLKEVTTAISGYRNKLVTLISPLLVIDAELKSHPHQKSGERPNPKEPIKPAYGKHNPAKPTTDKKELGPQAKQTTTADGMPLTVVEGDIPGLDFLKNYTGERLTNEDWEKVANELKCEVNAIRAVAKVESSGAGFDPATKRPIILFERHVFHEKSNHQYSSKYPDISSERSYLKIRDKTGKVIPERKADYDKAEKAGHLAESDYYPAVQLPNYKRLAKAMQLNREAALKSCSWGMFQVMGFNHAAAGFKDVESFVKGMATSEKEQMNGFLNFIKADKRLLKAVQEKNWLAFAITYNGKKQQGYDKKMENTYKILTKTTP
jgi:murein DD-endopeptidase MepM/ murein hydrolase activator NlpD